MKPVRIQRKRTAGYNMQAVSRATNGLACISVTRPGRSGNPYDVKFFGRKLSMELFRNSVEGVWNPAVMDEHSDELCEAGYAAHHILMKRFVGDHPLTAARAELRGFNMACYCRPQRRVSQLDPSAVNQFFTLVIADGHGIEVIGARSIATDDELLPEVDPHLAPGIPPQARLVDAVLALRHQPFEATFLHRAQSAVSCCLQ